MKLPILKNLAEPMMIFVALGVAVLVFDLNYYLMSTLIGSRNNACVVGANLTGVNLSFSALFSVMCGVLGAGVVKLYLQRRGIMKGSAISGIGMILGIFTMFCTACTFPIISLFGLSFGIGFFTDYSIGFQILSLSLLIYGLYTLNRQLVGSCEKCLI